MASYFTQSGETHNCILHAVMTVGFGVSWTLHVPLLGQFVQALVHTQASLEGSTMYKVALGLFISSSTSVFPCQYHSTNAPYLFTHLPSTLYNVFLPVLQFSLSVSFHHCSIHIHPSTTHAV